MQSPKTSRSARIRVDGEEIDLLWKILYAERGRLIDEKISLRDDEGKDTADVRRELALIRRMMEETQRAKEDLS